MIRMNYLIAILIATSASLSFAADTTPSDSAPSWAKEAQQEIKNKKYDAAINTLLAANQPSSADWNNLLGFAQRKKPHPI